MNTTLMTILNAGGDVSVHHRNALRRSLNRIDTSAFLNTLEQDLPRRDRRAASAVLTKAQALASGRGLRVEEGMRDQVIHLAGAADKACSGAENAATSGEAASGAEQGIARNTGQGGRPLTFREGVVRLSLTFTIYLIFLAFLLGVRRQLKERAARNQPKEDDQPIRNMDQSAT
ncbi:hypothetical protein [Tateyamaria sp. ANG-S1]|uniref:hypothetical protein n=1 Tax=Tateyamaria sp. ANG-S1 TaxID=1577905 RepID=UPI00187C48D5|nr:hypothetical protein [Tateyamaria sp. ANG-S1]